MFSLPSLGILSSPAADSITFKTDKAKGLARLYTEDVPASDHRFYSSILCHFHSASHAFDTFSIKDARRIRDQRPGNFKTLVQLLVIHLDSLKRDELFAAPEQGQTFAAIGKWVSAPLSPFGGGGGAADATQPRDRTKEALNCARLLARLVAVLMERQPTPAPGPGTPSSWTTPLEEEILWLRDASALQVQPPIPAEKPAEDPDQTEDQFVIEDEDDPDSEAATTADGPSTRNRGNSEAQKSTHSTSATLVAAQPALAERLLALCVDFLFFPGFTLPLLPEDDDTGAPEGSRVHFAIWERGVGSSLDLPGTTRQHLAHRVEFLRLFLVLLSKAVYVPPPAQMAFTDRALQFVCTSLSRTVTLPLLCSLLNTACKPDSGAGWHLPGLGGAQQEAEGKETLRALSLQILAILLEWTKADEGADSGNTGSRPSVQRTESAASLDTATSPNQFRYWISKVHRAPDLDMLSSSLFTLLQPAAGSLMSLSLSPSSPLGIPANSSQGVYAHSGETMTLLWHLLRNNAKFRIFVLDDTVRAPVLLGRLLSHALLGKDSPASHGMVRFALFTLQDVSSSPQFAAQIAKPGSAAKCRLPSKFSALINGANSASDILVAACYALLTTRGMGSSGLGVQPVVLLALANCAPAFKSLSIPSATRLSLLLTQFANPTFLLADEGHPRTLYFLLEAVNAVLVHQGAANRTVVYSMLGKSKEVERLKGFTLRKGLAEIRRRVGLAGPPGSAGVRESDSTPPAAAPSTAEASAPLLSAEEEKNRLAQRDAPEQGAAPGLTESGGAEDTDDTGAPRVPSEKALGKVRRTSTSVEVAASPGTTPAGADASPDPREEASDEWVNRLSSIELYEAASRVGKNGFIPSEEWVRSWVAGLPLGPLTALHRRLLPEMETLCASEAVANKADADQRVMAWLREQDLSFLSPTSATAAAGAASADSEPPGPPLPVARPFRWTEQVTVWLLSYLWGAIFVLQMPFAIWSEDSVRLFYLVQTHTPKRGSVEGGNAPAKPTQGKGQAPAPAATAGSGSGSRTAETAAEGSAEVSVETPIPAGAAPVAGSGSA